jgi:hypothetical protein
MKYEVKRSAAGAVIFCDNGEVIGTCGCCGMSLDEHGAEATVKKLEAGVVEWRHLKDAALAWEREKALRLVPLAIGPAPDEELGGR